MQLNNRFYFLRLATMFPAFFNSSKCTPKFPFILSGRDTFADLILLRVVSLNYAALHNRPDHQNNIYPFSSAKSHGAVNGVFSLHILYFVETRHSNVIPMKSAAYIVWSPALGNERVDNISRERKRGLSFCSDW